MSLDKGPLAELQYDNCTTQFQVGDRIQAEEERNNGHATATVLDIDHIDEESGTITIERLDGFSDGLPHYWPFLDNDHLQLNFRSAIFCFVPSDFLFRN